MTFFGHFASVFISHLHFIQNSLAQIENHFQYGLIYIKAELVLPLKGANFFLVKLELMTIVLTPGPLLVWSALLTTNSNSILNFKGLTSGGLTNTQLKWSQN